METENTTMAVPRLLEAHITMKDVMTIPRYGVALLTVLVNASIGIAFLVQKIRRPTVQVNPAGLVILNLLFGDAVSGVVRIFHMATSSTRLFAQPYWCTARLCVTYIVMTGSHIALVIVAVDRFMAITYALQYRGWMTFRRNVMMVICGWSIPLASLIGAIALNDWRSGQTLCDGNSSLNVFVLYVWIPSQIAAIIIVLLIQCRIYLCLRRYEAETVTTDHILCRSRKSASRILFQMNTTYVVCWCPYDVMLILNVVFQGPVIENIYQVTLVLAQISFVVNPLVYSYQTANIRKPVSDLCSDIKKRVWPARPSAERSPTSAPVPSQDIFVSSPTSLSESSVSTQVPSTPDLKRLPKCAFP